VAEKEAAEKEAAEQEAAEQEVIGDRPVELERVVLQLGSNGTAQRSMEFDGVPPSNTTLAMGHRISSLLRMNMDFLTYNAQDILERMLSGRNIEYLNRNAHPTEDMTWIACGWSMGRQQYEHCGEPPQYQNAFLIETTPHLVARAAVLLEPTKLLVRKTARDAREIWQVTLALRTCCTMLSQQRFPPTVVCGHMWVVRRQLTNQQGWPLPSDFVEADVTRACADFLEGLKMGLERLGLIQVEMAAAPRPVASPMVNKLQSNWQVIMNDHTSRSTLNDVLHDHGHSLSMSQYPENPCEALRPTASCTKTFLESDLMTTHSLVSANSGNFDVRSMVLHVKHARDESFKP
jgi:hypothetical protein